MNWKKTLIIAGIVAAGYLVVSNGSISKVVADLNHNEPTEQGLVTELHKVQRQNLTRDLNYLGTLESESKAMLSSKLSGTITSVEVAEGDIIHEGDMILQIDTSQYDARIESARQKKSLILQNVDYLNSEISNFHSSNPIMSRIESAELSLKYQQGEVEKLRILYEAGAISKSQLDQAEHQLNTANIQLKELMKTADSNYNKLVRERDVALGQMAEADASIGELELMIEEAQVRAPFDGQITQLMATIGEMAAPGKILVGIDSIKELRVVTQVGESDLKTINQGMRAQVVFSGMDQAVDGVVTYKSPSVNPKTRIGDIRVSVEIPEEVVVMGSSVRIRILLDEGSDEIMIPSSSVKSLGSESIIYVYGGDKRVYERKVTLGQLSEGNYQVLGGLEEGEIIATRNIQSLGDGFLIYVIEGGDIQ